LTNTPITRTVTPQWRREALKKALSEGPKNLAGDPAFESLAQLDKFFTPAEVCWLCNQALYQYEYQRAFHRKRAEVEKEKRHLARAAAMQARLSEARVASSASKLQKTPSLLLQKVRSLERAEDLSEAELDQLAQLVADDLLPTVEEIERERRLSEAFAKPISLVKPDED